MVSLGELKDRAYNNFTAPFRAIGSLFSSPSNGPKTPVPRKNVGDGPFRKKMMSDRPLLTDLFGELAYDQAGATALQKNQEPDDYYFDNPFNELPPSPVNPLGIFPDVEVKAGKVHVIEPWDPRVAAQTLKTDYRNGDVTQENRFWRTILDILPWTGTAARKRQLAQDLQNRYVKYATSGAKVTKVTKSNNLALLTLDNGDTVPVPLNSKTKQMLDSQGPEAVLKYMASQKADKIGDDLYKAIKQELENAPIGKKEIAMWIATSPYEKRLIDGDYRVDVNEKLPKTDPLNTNAAMFYGSIPAHAAKDPEMLKDLKQDGVPPSYVRSLKVAGDVAENNKNWVMGLTDTPNVAPDYGNAKVQDVAKWGAGTVMLTGSIWSAISGNVWLAVGLLIVGAAVLGFAIWESSRGGVNVRRRRVRKVYQKG